MENLQSLLQDKIKQHKKRESKLSPIKQALKDRYGESVQVYSNKKGLLTLTCDSAPLASNLQLELHDLKQELGVDQIRLRIVY